MQRVDPARTWPLHDAAASRQIEQACAAMLPPHTLMQRAGLVVARLALAVAPHARRVWIACGPGNNGGDGFEAAVHLRAAGREVIVTECGDPARRPPDAAASRQRALAAGVPVAAFDGAPERVDLGIDALLGLGASRAPDPALAAQIEALNRLAAPRLAVDLPSGLDADSGALHGAAAVRATHTLALLALKPGLFTAEGRDHAGTVWLDPLDTGAHASQASATLCGIHDLRAVRPPREHAGHKGRFGDVVVIGGAPGMGGALVLAARAAALGGAGRVLASPLHDAAPQADAGAPEVMWRSRLWDLPDAIGRNTVVAGCGGGGAIAAVLPALIARAPRLVLDADALNAVAADQNLCTLLRARAARGAATVLTPHPLEAARLLGLADARVVQAGRLAAAQQLAAQFDCHVVLKGSGTVVAAPGRVQSINPTGNGRLASAGTGDVLAGWLGGLWSAANAADAFDVARAAVWWHGAAAEDGDLSTPLTATALLDRLR
jgi:hydroxyethylthiazole kinase-like uncharacterized protein yjeF